MEDNAATERRVPVAERGVVQVSEATEVPTIVLENGGRIDEDGGMASSGGGGESEFRPKRKRGRPRKQLGESTAPVLELPASLQKRGRGRPRGSGKWQIMAASLGGTGWDIVGSHFTPHILFIQQGENIVEKLMAFSERSSDSLCILSACGTVSYAELLLPSTSTAASRTTYQGQMNIVSLNGSHIYDGNRRKICLLSVLLGYPDGRLCGGNVAASLISAAPTLLTIGTFRQNMRPPPIIRQHYPNTNITIASIPIQPENGKVSDSEIGQNGLNLIQSPSDQPVDSKPSASA